MSVEMRKRPIITGNDAKRFLTEEQRANENMQLLLMKYEMNRVLEEEWRKQHKVK